MAEIKDKVVTVESLSALHEYDEKTYLQKKNPVVSGDLKLGNSLSMSRAGTSVVGDNSVALGYGCSAIGANSCATGLGLKALGFAENVQGMYNIGSGNKDNSRLAHIVGNGSSDTNRSDAHTIDWDGNAWFAGDVYVGGVYTGVDSYGEPMFQGDPTKLVKSTNVVSIEYGDTLPPAGTVGRIFFKKLSG